MPILTSPPDDEAPYKALIVAGKGFASLIPIFGPWVTELIDVAAKAPLERRTGEWLTMVAEALNDVKEAIGDPEKLAANPAHLVGGPTRGRGKPKGSSRKAAACGD